MGFSIEVREKDGVRSLHFESPATQGAMRIERPHELVLEYTRAMMAPLLLREEGFPQRVLLIGLGAGSQAKFLYHHYPQAQLTVVEISARVVQVARERFALPPDDERLRVVVADGYAFMHGATDSYDLIVVDGFNEHAHPGELNTRAFYAACRERLRADGMLAVNLIGLSHNVKGGFTYIEALFGERACLLPRCHSGNTIALAASGARIELGAEALQARAVALRERCGLDLTALAARLAEGLRL